MAEVHLTARSPKEIRLFFEVTRCPTCQEGRLVGELPSEPAARLMTIKKTCANCGAGVTFYFDISPRENVASRLIDLSQWLTLHGMFAESAKHAATKQARRELLLQAGDCLDEALRFYDDPENDLPPMAAFFSEASLDRFRGAPAEFSRRRLLELRRTLPCSHPKSKS